MTQPNDTAPEVPRVPRIDIVLPPSADGASFSAYQAASAAMTQITLPEGARPQDFFVEAAVYQLPQALLSRVRASAQHMRRTETEIARDAAPTVQLLVYVAGGSDEVCEGQRTRAGPGDIVIKDSRRPYEAKASAFDVRIVMVAPDRVSPIYLVPSVHGLRLSGDEAGTRVLAAMIEVLLGEIEGLSAAEADCAVLALCQIGAGLVASQLARRDRDRRRWVNPQLDAGMAYIERRWAEAALTPEAVRAYLGLSRSGLYRLFAPLGGIEGVIRQRRLDHAMRSLLTGVGPVLALGEFSARHGFRNETQCVRAFQARFGATPLQAHARISSGDRAWLGEQAGRAGFTSLQLWLAALTQGSPEGDGLRPA